MAAREGCRLRWHGALDQVIVEGHEELGFTGIALAPGPPSHVHLEPPDSRPIRAQHTQTAPVGNVVALGAIRAAEDDIHPPPSHLRYHGDRTKPGGSTSRIPASVCASST